MYGVIQVIPQLDYSVIVYFSDGIIKKYDTKPLIEKGMFKKIADIETFTKTCTVMNNTLAWNISGHYDPYSCLDIAPDTIYNNSITISDPLSV